MGGNRGKLFCCVGLLLFNESGDQIILFPFLCVFTARKFAKVMFLQVSVILSTGGEGACVVAPGGHAWLLLGGHAWLLWGGVRGCSGGHAWLLPGGHAWLLQGVCVVAPGGACVVAPGGHAWFFGGACVVFSGGRAWFFQ